MPNQFKFLFVVAAVINLSSCATTNPNHIASHAGFKAVHLQTKPFNLAGFEKITQPGSEVNIYIEGDGSAWLRHNMISSDPSPRKPLTLKLATLDPNPNVVYLARPCQYSPTDLTTVCEQKYWTFSRYSKTVVNAMNQAITQIKHQAQAQQINLIGFSGGATIAILVAAQRKDIKSIRTVAGNLDLIAMEKYHATSPLTDSLDPMHVAQQVKHVPQLHFIGNKDTVVPIIVTRNFQQAAGLAPDSVVVLHKVGHNDGWTERWLELLGMRPSGS